MDQIKIGKFIQERRKLVGLTQMGLADKLGITDRAVSKWETGRALPDSSLMLELCRALKITVNDLLSGEVVSVENYNSEMEQKLVEMVKEKERSDKRMLALEVVIGVLSTIIIIVPCIAAAYLPLEEWVRVIIAFSGFIPGLIGFVVAMRIEQVAGYYMCGECGHRYVPSFKTINLSMHMGRTRYMKCPRCGKKSWQKKVIGKGDE